MCLKVKIIPIFLFILIIGTFSVNEAFAQTMNPEPLIVTAELTQNPDGTLKAVCTVSGDYKENRDYNAQGALVDPKQYRETGFRPLLSAVRPYSYLLWARALRNTICSSLRPPTSTHPSRRHTTDEIRILLPAIR